MQTFYETSYETQYVWSSLIPKAAVGNVAFIGSRTVPIRRKGIITNMFIYKNVVTYLNMPNKAKRMFHARQTFQKFGFVITKLK